MNNTDIQRLINSPDASGAVKLPMGEFEGPFVVSKPCIIVGNNTTLWRRSGTVLDIRSPRVKIKNIQAEITGGSHDSDIAIYTAHNDTVLENVNVCGRTQGIPDEDGFWGVPKVINGGNIPADTPFNMYMEVTVPAETDIIVNISGIRAEPSHIGKGRSVITITADPVSDGTVMYGDIEFRSRLSRRCYLSLTANSSVASQNQSGQIVYKAPEESELAPARISEHIPGNAQSMGQYISNNSPVTAGTANTQKAPVIKDGRLMRGQRVSIKDTLGSGPVTAELFYSAMDVKLDIDTYTFLLNEDEKAWSDKCLIFFGNNRSEDGTVMYTDDGQHRIVRLDLDNIPRIVQKISIAYSIYGDNPNHNFSKLHGGVLVLRNGERTLEFPVEGLFMETTVVAAEFYRRGDVWKLCAVGQGYKDGLKRLCTGYGLNIND